MVSGTDSKRSSRIDGIVLDHLQRRISGEHVSDAALIAEHPDLMPELADRLAEIAELHPQGTTIGPTTEHDSWLNPRALRIRCPHCNQGVEVLADSDFEGITCRSCGSQFSLAGESLNTRAAPARKQIAQFELVERLGLGSFGTVWKARDTELERTVAIKIPRRGQLDPSQIDQFLREARSAAQLNHKNIVRVYEVGTDGGNAYIVSELIRGVSLADWLSGMQPTFRQTATLCAKIADALHHAHESGVVHRDLKPQNIMLDSDDEPHIMDFGLAKREAGEITMTMDGQMLGTPAYMSPEQARGEAHQADRRADVYSLGVILFELLTGELPFRGNARMLIHQVLHDEPPSPRRLNSNVPRDLETICLKCLEKDPTKRCQTADEVSAELQRYVGGEPIHARPISAATRAWRFCTRNPMAATVMGLVLFLAVAGPLLAIRQSKLAADESAARRDAVAARQAERRLTFNMALNRGLTQCQQGHVSHGMLWLAHALEIAPPRETAMRRVILANLNSWRHELNSLEAIFPHEQAVINVAISPDSKLILTGSVDKTAQLWNVDTSQRVGKPLPHDGDVHEVVFSPDGSRILTASYDGMARLWEAKSGILLRTVRHQGAAQSGAFSPDSSRIVTSSGSFGEVKIWDADSGAVVGELRRQGHSVHDLAISSDGLTILTACHDKNARLWDFHTHELIATFKHDTRVPTAAFRGAHGSQIVTGDSDGNVYLWDVAAAIADDDRKLETAKKEFIGGPWRHRGGVHRLRVRPDGSRIVTASFDNTARLWDPDAGGQVGGAFDHQGAVQGAAISSDGSLVVTACDDNAARLWRPAAGQSLRIIEHAVPGDHEAIYTSDGIYILTKNDDQTALVHDAKTGVRICAIPVQVGIRALAVSPDDSKILLGTLNGTQLWDMATGKRIGEPHHGGQVWSVAVSSDGARMLSGAFGGSVQLRDAGTGALIGEPLELGVRVHGVAFSPDGSRFVVTCGDKMIRVYDANLGNIPRTIAGHRSAVVGLAISRDGTLIVTGGHDNTVRVWNAATGAPASDPMPHQGPIWYEVAVAISPDGQTVVTGCDDRTVQLWDVATAKPIGPALTHKAGVRMVAFTGDDGSQVRTGTTVGTVRLWDVSISPLEDNIDRIMLWLHVATGMELDSDTGEVRVVDGATWNQLRQRLDELGGPPVP